MRFYLHGTIHPETQAALIQHEHACHAATELTPDSDAATEIAADPAVLLGLLQKKQWNLLTSDSEFVRQIYERRVEFSGIVIVLLNSDAGGQPDALLQAAGIHRLFERYPRLTPRRMYTVTPSRVKIRQLPGAAQA